jgi:cell filamentation protein
MREKPGEVVGYLAYGHPFLDGNGRTIMLLHAVLADRAGFSIDWAATSKDAYLGALTEEIDQPGKGALDRYLLPFVREGANKERIAEIVSGAPGLDGNSDNAVLGKITEPAIAARYEALELKRQQAEES